MNDIDPMFLKRKLRSKVHLLDLGFREEEMREHLERQQQYLDLIAEYELAEKNKDFGRSYELELEIVSLAPVVHFSGEDPAKLPVDILRYLANEAPDKVGPDPVNMQYRKRVKGKAPAIRAKCVTCMGGQPALVRDCGSTTCPLWPFRLGTNPLRGVIPPPVPLIDIPEELLEQLREEIEENEDNEKDDTTE